MDHLVTFALTGDTTRDDEMRLRDDTVREPMDDTNDLIPHRPGAGFYGDARR